MIKAAKNAAAIFITAAAVYFCVVYPQSIGNAVKEAVDRCLYVIVPSMFIFLCITAFISNSGIHSILGIPFRFLSEKLFRLPKEGFTVFLLSMISGYPAGIKLVSENFRSGNLTANQAGIMNNFCCCAGPAFITGTAAAFLYPDSNAGILIFISVITGNLITALILTRTLDRLHTRKKSKTVLKQNQLIPSVKSAASAMLQMCIMIAAFGGFSCILKLSGIIAKLSEYLSDIIQLPESATESIIMTFLEISNIITLPPIQTGLFPVTAFLISFGGICVHMQIITLADNNFSAVNFFFSRLFSAAVSGVTAYFLMPFLNINVSCSTGFRVISQGKYSPIPSFLLIIMCCMLLGIFENKKGNAKKHKS